MTARDRKIVTFVVPLLVLAGYWFLILAPKRDDAAKAETELAKAQQTRDQAQSTLSQLEAAKASFGADYEAVARLGKAIPSSVDMPTLIVQLDKAARGTNIDFDKISAGARDASQPGSSASPSGSTPQSGSSSQSAPPASPSGNAAPGGEGAVSAPGRAAETAGNKVNGANAKSAATEKGTAAPGSGAQQGSSTGSSPAGAGHVTTAPGLDSVPLTFSFTGSFFDLADFLHRLKRFVRVAGDRIDVRGRLMTLDDLTLTTDQSSSKLKAEVSATVFLAPKAQGATAGATPSGPAGATTGAASGGTPTPGAGSASAGVPAATVTP
jgi:Tfp pilus assembly protein PilO